MEWTWERGIHAVMAATTFLIFIGLPKSGNALTEVTAVVSLSMFVYSLVKVFSVNHKGAV